MKYLLLVFCILTSLYVTIAGADGSEADVLTLQRSKRQAIEDVNDLRKKLNVYPFTSTDYPAIFAIFAGMTIILSVAILFIAVGVWNMDPGKDSIIYRMTTTRMKKD